MGKRGSIIAVVECQFLVSALLSDGHGHPKYNVKESQRQEDVS